MKRLPFTAMVLAAALSVFAAGAAQAEETSAAASAAAAASQEEVKAASAKVKNPALKDHLLRNIDIFGKNDLPAIYILMPGASPEEEIQGSLLTRDFSRDPFFMQNIDREEFEMKTSLREFTEEDDQAAEKKTVEVLRR